MKQLNLNLTPEFERDLNEFMKRRKVTQKSEAVRQALREAVEKLNQLGISTDFRNWRGMALKAPLKTKRKFRSEDDLWS